MRRSAKTRPATEKITPVFLGVLCALLLWQAPVQAARIKDIVDIKGARQNQLAEDDMIRSPESGPSSKLERKQSMHRVQSLLGELPERQRQAVLLKFDAGLSYKEIAEVMEISVSNVGFILHTALRTVRERLGEDELPLSAARRAL